MNDEVDYRNSLNSVVEELFDAPGEPMKVARKLMVDYERADGRTLHAWRGGWMLWETSHWAEIESATLRSEVYKRMEHAHYIHPKDGRVPWAPTKKKIADVMEALAAVAHLPESIDTPSWLTPSGTHPAGELVACRNGLLDVETRKMTDHTPSFFNRVAVPFDYDPDAPTPVAWLRFLKELWPDDEEAVAALQEFFGYVLSGRTDQQKILLMIGPTRSGKGTIARVLTELVGRGNAAGPTLASLGTNFGLAPLLGKPVAVVSDARLDRTNASAVVERLLSISGEDMLTVDRKYREPWTGKLSSRFVILSNELPRFGDASGAIAGRFIVLTMARSFLGRENTRLTAQLLAELPGILAWSLDGLDRLVRRERFTIPSSSDDTILALQDLVSPTAAFVRDRCRREPEAEVAVDELFGVYRAWCEDNSHRVPSVQTFGRDLRAVVPGIRMTRPRYGGSRIRQWRGVRLARPEELEDDGEDSAHSRGAPQSADRGPARTTNPNAGETTKRSAVVRGLPIVGPTCPRCAEPLDGPAGMTACESKHAAPHAAFLRQTIPGERVLHFRADAPDAPGA